MKKYLPVIISSILSVTVFITMLIISPSATIPRDSLLGSASTLHWAACMFPIVIFLYGAASSLMQLWAQIGLASDEAQRMADQNVELKQMKDHLRDLAEQVNNLKIKTQMTNGF